MRHTFNSTIIRSYDIRGIVNKTLDTNDARVIGHLFALSLKTNKVVNVGYDGRISSVPLKDELIKGLIEGGADVNDIGLGPTPMLYYSCYYNSAEAGIMITGSHNPSNHNGFKIVKNNLPFYGKDLITLSNNAKDYELGSRKGKSKKIEIKDHYIEKLHSSLKQSKKINIAWDSGNGAAGQIMKSLSKSVLGKSILLYEDIDGNFPNHHPDPSDPENLKDLIKCVKENKLDFGIAFDGDGDRIGLVDDLGRVVPGDLLLLIFAQELIKKKQEATIIGDVKCSQVLFDYIEKLGGKAIMYKTGHSLIKDCMKKENADLAGEMSGHIFFADGYYGFDDALYASVRLINLFSESDKKLSEIIDDFPKLFNTPEIRIDCDDNEKFNVIDSVLANQKNKKYSSIDGVRVDLGFGWWLLRASNTQAAIVLRCEGNSIENLNQIIKTVKYELNKVSPELSKQILT